MNGPVKNPPPKSAGFTLVELLTVVAIIGILTSLTLSSVARAKRKAQEINCLSNLRQLSLAAKMYADDNQGRLVSSWPLGNGTTTLVNPYSWCPGWASTKPMDPVYGPAPLYSATNVYALQQGMLWPYTKSAAIYRCPADIRYVDGQPVVRSYSMNSWMNGKSYGDPTGKSNYTTPQDDLKLTYILFRNENQIRQPDNIWCLIDEDESSINDSLFLVDMGPENTIADIPSNRHGNTYVVTFADGHVEPNKLLASRVDWYNSDDPDWLWLKGKTTVRRE